MTSEEEEILSAFVDGEDYDPQVLMRALAAPGAQACLIDFVRLRADVVDEEQPSPEFYGAMRAALSVGRGSRLWWAAKRAAAAAVLAFALLGVFDLAQRLRTQPGGDAPPRADRVVRFEPGVDWNAKEQ